MALLRLVVFGVAALAVWAVSCVTMDHTGLAPGAGGSGGGTGGSGGGTGAECVGNADCPGLFTECGHPECVNGVCGTFHEAPGTACTENEGAVCDGAGECVECVDETQCDGGLVCDQNTCVPAGCVDGALNGDETDVDCGGSCAPCENGKLCSHPDDCQSGFCAESGTCAPCSGHSDCDDVSEWCDEGACVPKEDNGSECDDPVECVSGSCPGQDHVCCDSACEGHCYACLDGKNDAQHGQGECGPVTTDTDLDGECGQQSQSTCQSDGRGCDGAGACLLWPSGTVCTPGYCSGDTQIYDDTCDGSGSCDDTGIGSCAPYICEGSACRTSCTGDGDCLSGSWCDGLSCVSQGSLGDPCGSDNECNSGSCEDGYCCESACTGECMACAASKTDGPNGDCQAISHNTDPDNECTDGACYRIDANNGECRQYQGDTCTAGSDCMNGICVDNRCCENSCTGTCMACRGDWTVGSAGECANIINGTDPDGECPGGNDSCCSGVCDIC